MKKTIILASIIVAGIHLQAQNTPVDSKGTPTSNKDLPSNNPSLGSNSGVNPAGNPGTIISYSGNSNSINNQTTPNPNIEKGVFLNSSPAGTVINNPVAAGSNIESSTTVITGNGGAVTIDEAKPKPVAEVAVEAPRVPAPNPPVVTNSSLPPTAPIASSGMVTRTNNGTKAVAKNNKSRSKVSKVAAASPAIVKEKNIPAYSPLLSNYIPQQVIAKVKAKYGLSVYDITRVKVVQNNKIAYLVRISENGKFKSEIYYDEP